MLGSRNIGKTKIVTRCKKQNQNQISRAKHELRVAACSACKCYGWQHAIDMASAMVGSMHVNYGMCYGWQHARKDAAQIVVSLSRST